MLVESRRNSECGMPGTAPGSRDSILLGSNCPCSNSDSVPARFWLSRLTRAGRDAQNDSSAVPPMGRAGDQGAR